MEVHSWLLNSWHQEKQTIVMVTHDLDEAILLSDRVFILSQRPASIVGEVQVKLPRPRTMDMLTSLELKKDKEEILRVLAPYEKNRKSLLTVFCIITVKRLLYRGKDENYRENSG